MADKKVDPKENETVKPANNTTIHPSQGCGTCLFCFRNKLDYPTEWSRPVLRGGKDVSYWAFAYESAMSALSVCEWATIQLVPYFTDGPNVFMGLSKDLARYSSWPELKKDLCDLHKSQDRRRSRANFLDKI